MDNEHDDPRQNAGQDAGQDAEQNTEMEELLRMALARHLPLPEGFAERVVLKARTQRTVLTRTRMQHAVAAVLVLGLLVGFSGGWWAHQHQERVDAARRLALALSITGNTLRSIGCDINARLQQVGARRDTHEEGALQ